MKKFATFLLLLLSLCLSLQAQVDNYCLRFTDEAGVVNCGRIVTLKQTMSYTLQMWINPSEWKGGAALLRCGAFSMRLGNDHSLLLNDGTGFFYATSDKLEAGRWTHITMRTSREDTTVYIDNSLVATFPMPLVFPCDVSSIWLGGGYKGRIDEVRVWRGVLSQNNESYWRNTLNELNPSWSSLLAYWKMDQEKCPNLVDYRGTRHGVLSAHGVVKEKVTDNAAFKYLKALAYGNVERYFDRMVDQKHYQLANTVSIIGARLNTSNAHVYYDVPLNNAALVNGAERLDEYQGRKGVLSLPTAFSRLNLPAGLLDGQENYTFETWLYLDEWTADGYIYRAESNDGMQGVSLRLGQEEDGSLILRCNGNEFLYRNVIRKGRWSHVGFYPRSTANSPTQLFCLAVNGITKSVKAADAPTEICSTRMPNLNAVSALGENIVGKLDDTMFFTSCRSSFSEDSRELPFPSETRSMNPEERYSMLACYTYDLPDRPELDFFSVPGYIMKMRENVAGMRGARFTLTVAANNFDGCLADDNKRVQIADDIAAMANDPAFDGVDLDFEWTYTPWGWRYYARLCENLYYRVNQGKTISVSPHKVAYNFPTDLMWTVNYFNFQIYDAKDLATTSGFEYAFQLFESAGYPKDKMLLSYATTTTEGYMNGKVDKEKYPTKAYRYLYPADGEYDPTQNYLTGEEGEQYWLPSYNQVVWRAKYVRDHDLAGIMYWDMGGDLEATHKHSYARGASYYINSNVETLVTSVKTTNVAPEEDPYAPIEVDSPDDQKKENLTELTELSDNTAFNILNANGLGLVYAKDDTDALWLGSSINENFHAWQDPNTPAAAWLLLQYEGNHYLYNLGRKKFVEVTRFDETSQSCRLVDDPMPIEVVKIGTAQDEAGSGLFTFRTYTDDDRAYMCASPQLSQRPVCQWTQEDGGSKWLLVTCPYTCTLPYMENALSKVLPTGVVPSISNRPSLRTNLLYDLQGRMVSTPRKGLFIQNGRKVLGSSTF